MTYLEAAEKIAADHLVKLVKILWKALQEVKSNNPEEK